MRVFDVFVPAGVPTVTYVQREERDLERQLGNALRTPGLITSISGPSKSGKTVLTRRVIDADMLISVGGAAVTSPEVLWERVLNWMEAPSQTSQSRGDKVSAQASGKVSGMFGAIVARVTGEVGAAAGVDATTERSSTFERGGLDQVIKEIGGSDFVVFIDDYHYMTREVQAAVARQIKEAAEKGVKICTASVPHRKDDVVRGNPELRGRVQNVDFAYWSTDEIIRIGQQGFEALNVVVPDAVLRAMAEEAFGSPQLMQQICLQACLRLGIEELSHERHELDIDTDTLRKIFEQASTTTDFTSLLEGFHTGPKKRGTVRKEFRFSDGSTGDVYRCVLLAMKADPPRLSFPYDEIYARAKAVCDGDAPVGSSISSALEQLPALATDLEASSAIVDWSDDVLDVVDPYFLYYLRCSPKLASLGA